MRRRVEISKSWIDSPPPEAETDTANPDRDAGSSGIPVITGIPITGVIAAIRVGVSVTVVRIAAVVGVTGIVASSVAATPAAAPSATAPGTTVTITPARSTPRHAFSSLGLG
jgi:hypothetical protein